MLKSIGQWLSRSFVRFEQWYGKIFLAKQVRKHAEQMADIAEIQRQIVGIDAPKQQKTHPHC